MFDDTLKREMQRAYVEQRRQLRGIARRAGSADVDDVVQDAFVKVIELSHRQDVRTLDRLLAYVARCVAIDRLRRRSSKLALISDRSEKEGADVAADPERLTISSQRLQRVLTVIDEMPPRRRQVFLLHRVDEMSYVQIAKSLGISVKAVEKHIHLALVQLCEADD